MELHGIFSCPESLSIGLDLFPNEMQLPQRSFRTIQRDNQRHCGSLTGR